MSPRKLTPDDKQEILDLYRQTPETTSTLAEKFGVSSSTISRFLKTHLADDEYEVLIQQKRLARTSKTDIEEDELNEGLSLFSPPSPSLAIESKPTIVAPIAPIIAHLPKRVVNDVKSQEDLTVQKDLEIPPPIEAQIEANFEEVSPVPALTLGELFGEEINDLDPEDDLEDEDEDLDDEDLDDDEDEDWEDGDSVDFTDVITSQEDIKVLPLSDANFPRTCYLVIDRTSELIARPLKDFSHLGTIPPEETLQKTLPVFDNHRVARRFSNRFQRVIKVPDGKLLQKTSPHLKAKGITRLIMDGRIYSLSSF
jgi:transposase-like protein